MSEWCQRTLGDLIHVKHGYAFKGEFFVEEGEKLVLKPGNFPIGGGITLRPGKDAYYTGDYPPDFELAAGDLLVVMTDLTQAAPILGAPAFVPAEPVMLHNQRLGLVQVKPGVEVDRRFLYYAMLSDTSRSQIRATATGATVRHTAPERIYRVKLGIPDLSTQRVIGEVLGSIDDLIENNRRRIEVLEEMARAIYREWFVKFRYPGHGDVPLVDSALGPIPEGWHVGRVGSFGRIVTGATPSTKQPRYWGEAHDTPFLTPTEMGWRRLYARPARHLSDAGVASVKSRLLPAGAVCFSSIGSIGKVTLAVKPLVTNQQVNSVVVDHSVTSESYVYEALSHASERIRGMASGSATPIINKSTFADIRMVMTPPSLAHLFGREVGLLHSLITKLEEHSSRLGAIRDLLLPQLVTGQIDVSSLNLDTLIAEQVA